MPKFKSTDEKQDITKELDAFRPKSNLNRSPLSKNSYLPLFDCAGNKLTSESTINNFDKINSSADQIPTKNNFSILESITENPTNEILAQDKQDIEQNIAHSNQSFSSFNPLLHDESEGRIIPSVDKTTTQNDYLPAINNSHSLATNTSPLDEATGNIHVSPTHNIQTIENQPLTQARKAHNKEQQVSKTSDAQNNITVRRKKTNKPLTQIKVEYEIFHNDSSVELDTFSIDVPNQYFCENYRPIIESNLRQSLYAPNHRLRRASVSNWSLSDNMAIPIKDITDLIREYKGEEDGLNSFIKNIDKLWNHIATYDAADMARFLLVLQLKLTDKAADATKNVNFDNWEEVKKALKENINPQTNIEKAELKLMTVKQQPKEELEEYGKRVEQLMDNLNKSFDLEGNNEIIKKQNNRRAKKAFEDGLLSRELKNKAIGRGIKTLREAIDYVTEQELRQSELNWEPLEKYCTYCNMKNHNTKECNRLAQNRRSISNQSISNTPNPRNQNSPLPNKSEVICYRCNKKGHYAPECRSGHDPGPPQRQQIDARTHGQSSPRQNRMDSEVRNVRFYDIDMPIEETLTYAEQENNTKN